MSVLDAYRDWRERRHEAAWEREALHASTALDAAIEAESPYETARHYRAFLETVKGSRFQDRYDENSAKTAILDRLHRKLDKDRQSLDTLLGAEPGYRPLGDILAELGITKDDISTYHQARVTERRTHEKEQLLRPLRTGQQVEAHDLIDITSKARAYDLTPDEHAGLRSILLQTLAGAAKADLRWLASDNGLTAYRGLKAAVQSYGATEEAIRKACGNTEQEIKEHTGRLEKHQDWLYETALDMASRGDPNTIDHARKFIAFSQQYSIALDENRETLEQVIREIDQRYRSARTGKQHGGTGSTA